MKNLLYMALVVALASQAAYSQIVMAPPTRVQVAPELAEKMLIHKPDPVVLSRPMAARVMGTVVMKILISRTGHVLSPKVISGPRMLQQPALDAVRKYEYKPYLLNGQPVEVTTRVSIHFSLD